MLYCVKYSDTKYVNITYKLHKIIHFDTCAFIIEEVELKINKNAFVYLI